MKDEDLVKLTLEDMDILMDGKAKMTWWRVEMPILSFLALVSSYGWWGGSAYCADKVYESVNSREARRFEWEEGREDELKWFSVGCRWWFWYKKRCGGVGSASDRDVDNGKTKEI